MRFFSKLTKLTSNKTANPLAGSFQSNQALRPEIKDSNNSLRNPLTSPYQNPFGGVTGYLNKELGGGTDSDSEKADGNGMDAKFKGGAPKAPA